VSTQTHRLSSTQASEPEPRNGLAAARVGAATVAGGVTLPLALVAGASVPVAVSLGWDLGALVFLLWVWVSIGGKDAAASARAARTDDVSRATADIVLLCACAASLIAVASVLVEAGHRSGSGKGLLIGAAVITVALAWASVHTVFTLRYGSLYYELPVGGIDFNSDEPPDYRDLAYVALTIGMTFQVSDTDLTNKPVRRTATRHALLSFMFGAVIVAITINIVASLLNG
jgi:uncharacterized membrane protein